MEHTHFDDALGELPSLAVGRCVAPYVAAQGVDAGLEAGVTPVV